MTHGLSGKFIMIDGLDGIGKSVAINAIIGHLMKKGLKVFDLHDFWKDYHDHPDFENEMPDFDVLVSSEPTYVVAGRALRNEIISQNNRNYSASVTAQAYALDRLILYKRVILPALKAGKTVIQSRGVSTSLVYQPIQSNGLLTMQEIASLEGNDFCLENSPDLLIITTINNAKEVMSRLSERVKKDNCVFENLEFQMNIKPVFESLELKNMFENRGTKIKYLDAGISVEETRNQAISLYEELFG